jgi:hypothetical protein
MVEAAPLGHAQEGVDRMTERAPRIVWSAPAGTQRLPDDTRYVGRFQFEGDSGSKYIISYDTAGNFWTCSCKGAVNRGECKHLKKYGRSPMRVDVVKRDEEQSRKDVRWANTGGSEEAAERLRIEQQLGALDERLKLRVYQETNTAMPDAMVQQLQAELAALRRAMKQGNIGEAQAGLLRVRSWVGVGRTAGDPPTYYTPRSEEVRTFTAGNTPPGWKGKYETWRTTREVRVGGESYPPYTLLTLPRQTVWAEALIRQGSVTPVPSPEPKKPEKKYSARQPQAIESLDLAAMADFYQDQQEQSVVQGWTTGAQIVAVNIGKQVVLAGPQGRRTLYPGDTVTVDAPTAGVLVDRGYGSYARPKATPSVTPPPPVARRKFKSDDDV